jgi:hypothetical protein
VVFGSEDCFNDFEDRAVRGVSNASHSCERHFKSTTLFCFDGRTDEAFNSREKDRAVRGVSKTPAILWWSVEFRIMGGGVLCGVGTGGGRLLGRATAWHPHW